MGLAAGRGIPRGGRPGDEGRSQRGIVTTRDVAAGDSSGADAVQLVEVPRPSAKTMRSAPTPLDGAGGVAGARALVSIPANTQLSPQMIAGSAADGRLAAQLAAGMEAVSLSVNDETGVAGQVQPFDEVRVVCVTEAAGGAVSLDELCASARVMSVGGDGAGEGCGVQRHYVGVDAGAGGRRPLRRRRAPSASSSSRAACCREVWSSMMDRGTELALKRAVREGLATRLQGDFDPVEVESAIQSRLCKRPCGRGTWALQSRHRSLMPFGRRRFPSLRPLCKGCWRTLGSPRSSSTAVAWRWTPELQGFWSRMCSWSAQGDWSRCPYVRFDDADHLRRIIDKIAEQAGMRCDEAHAMGCAMLPGGKARATYIVPPLAPDGPALNLRLFGDDVMSIEDLTARGALSP